MITETSFNDFNLDPKLLAALTGVGFENASPIQEMTIPPILEGKDIFAQAETGSGKTGSFAIPILEQILRNHDVEKREVLYVVLSPTRELAQQTHKVFSEFGETLGIHSTCVIGGENIEKQKELLGHGTHIVVATPGRLRDLVNQKVLDLSGCKGIVFDEADRLFDMGFQKDIEFTLNQMDKSRQLIMVSATSNFEILNTAYKFHSHPLELKLNEDQLVVKNIDHQLAMVTKEEKFSLLVQLLRDKDEHYALVFCNTQFQTHAIGEWLNAMNFKAKAISGKMAQNKRTKMLEDFRSKKIDILVCTDVAARGLDIEDVNFVVNYDLPQEAANYVHRIGRTGRAGKLGHAVSFCAFEDCENLDDIYEFLGEKVPKMDLEDKHFAKDICKKPYLDAKTLQVTERESKYEKKGDRSKGVKGKTTREPYKKHVPSKEILAMGAESEKSKTMNTKTPSDDPKSLEITTYNKASADKVAMEHFELTDAELLGSRILETGKKKFIIFGAKNIKYKYYVKPLYKKLLLPHLIKVIKMMDLNIRVNISYKDPYLRVNFTGKDEGLFAKDKGELLNSFESIVRGYLVRRINVPRKLRYSFKVQDDKDDQKQEKYLVDLVTKTIDKVNETGAAVTLKSMSSRDRRIVHQLISDTGKFNTTSIGDGRFKKIEISPK